MTETSLQKSELVISKILEALLETGLQHGTWLKFEKLDLSEEYEPFFDGCCVWLLEEGIVRCSNTQQALGGGVGMINPMITSYGFAILDQKLTIAQSDVRVGQAVREVARGSRNYAGVGDFIGGILGGFTKSISS